MKNRTINKELTYLMSFLKWCRSAKGIAIDVKIDMLQYDRPKPVILSPGEVLRFLEAAENDKPFWLAFFLVLYTLGFRLSEAKYLRWRDVDRDNMTVRAVQKGGDDKIGALDEWLDEALKKLPQGGPDDYIFLIKRTGRAVDNPRRAIDRICAAADPPITKRVTPHIFRHSIATHMLANDTNLRTIQQMLGHRDVSTTQKYTHVVTDHIRAATRGMFKAMHKSANDHKRATSTPKELILKENKEIVSTGKR